MGRFLRHGVTFIGVFNFLLQEKSLRMLFYVLYSVAMMCLDFDTGIVFIIDFR